MGIYEVVEDAPGGASRTIVNPKAKPGIDGDYPQIYIANPEAKLRLVGKVELIVD